MSKIFEGIALPILFIAVVTTAAIFGIIASVEADNIGNNQKFTKQKELENANRNLVIGYILYFVSIGCVIISLLTHLYWKEAPSWLQVLLVSVGLITVIIGVVFTIIASNDLKNIIGGVRSLALWSVGFGIGGIVLGLLLVYFRSVSYIREHEIKEEKAMVMKKEELEQSTPTTIQTKSVVINTPNNITPNNITTSNIPTSPYPIMLS